MSTLPDLTHQRCLNHGHREAVARCPGCGRYFCRECITEHNDRVMCAACLRKLARTPFLHRRAWARMITFGVPLLGVLISWFFFYAFGEVLLKLPTSFHEGTLWQSRWFE